MQADLLIHGGTLLDGSGSPGYKAAVAVRGDRLVIVRGDTAGVDAGHVIDASGLVVAPGFIDMHSHSGLMILSDPAHEPKVRQGVTTEVIGVDGNSYAPILKTEDLSAFVRLNSGLDGRPSIAYDWGTVASYLSKFDCRVGVNLALMIGNSALRICALGWDNVLANRRSLSRMKGMLREGMEEGAFGLSTGLDYPPGSYATTDELVHLTGEVAKLGGIYHTHVRYTLGDRFLDPFREAITIGERSGVPVHLTHLYRRTTQVGGSARLLDLVESAADIGVDVTFDSYPYEWSSTRLLMLIPQGLQEGGPDRLKERLADPARRAEVRTAIEARAEAYGGAYVWRSIHLGAFTRPENAAFEGKTIAEIVAMQGERDPADVLCDLLLSEDLGVNQVSSGPDPASLPQFFTHPRGMVGSDSVFIGERPSPRTYGTFARILADLVREERRLSLPDAIRRMTSFPAQRLGLSHRGLLRDDMIADITVFDAEHVGARATYYDPRRFAEGVKHVLVNGVVVLDNGQMTGARPGRALRRGRS